MKKIFIFVIASISVMMSCDTSLPYEVEDSLFVNSKSVVLYYGDTQQLTASPSSRTYSWTSEDPSIATVSATGLVEGVGNGSTNVIAAYGEIKTTIPVTVNFPTLDGALARSGRNRVLLEITINSDRIKTVKAVRKDNGASQEFDINYKSGVIQAYYTSLQDGVEYTFNLIAIDKFGNEASPVEVSAWSYGDTYASTLQNRKISVATLFGNGLAIGWQGTNGVITNLKYKNRYGASVERAVPVATNTYLIDFGSDLSFSTSFLPDRNACDTFVTAWSSYSDYVDKHGVLKAGETTVIAITDFDIGGEGVGYHDSDATNSGNNAYRANAGDGNSPGVDVEGGLNIGYTNAGEWLMFSVDAVDAGTYLFDVNLSVNNGDGSRYSLEVDGVKTQIIEMVNNSNWSDWRWYNERNGIELALPLSKGVHTVKFYLDGGGFNIMNVRFAHKP
jgi:hypothetical protein